MLRTGFGFRLLLRGNRSFFDVPIAEPLDDVMSAYGFFVSRTQSTCECRIRRPCRFKNRQLVQFRKRVRLFEARRLLVARETNVTSSAFAVGYVSLAQFVRDYKELFGLPPLCDIKQLHNASDD